MDSPGLEPDWLAGCRRIVGELRTMFEAHPTTRDRAVELGRGAGGDLTLVIDDGAEEIIFAELERLHGGGHDFTVISEERGEVAFGGGEIRVVVDPIDGSLNAKRGLSPYTVSIAVADGPSMADISFGFVYDFGADEEWTARRGRGALLNGRALGVGEGERRSANGLLELIAVELARPDRLASCGPALDAVAHRLRMSGSIAFALCQLAGGRVDGMLTLQECRSVDAAAAQLIVRESGGHVAFTATGNPLGALLALSARSPLIAARTPAALAQLRSVPSSRG
ncbi:MAG: inositol monophosphatase family protein [Solirubrobacteraceae bacterium]|jgi:myo-inositol-1(or 4)-monophosphatase